MRPVTKLDQWSQQLRELRDPAALFGGSPQTAVPRPLALAGELSLRRAFDSLTRRAPLGRLAPAQDPVGVSA